MIQIIPAIDLIDGKCVRLTQGDYAQKKEYNTNPLAVAQSFEEAGLTRLHLVDLDGARQKRIVNHRVLERIATHTRLHIDFGGGVQSDEDIALAFSAGAHQVTGGSVAVRNRSLFERWLERYGSEKIILGADARAEKIAVGGWQEATETSVFDFVADYAQKGIRYVISTDVAKDGLLQGPSFELYRQLQNCSPSVHLIASGGVSSVADILGLNEMGIFGVIVGKAIYEGRISLAELEKLNR
ncbi:MAG: 1-(5-phosphoribosyl)-5-[(5-phosphoribosylamino)methylideneamino]imidazole-4-carboxamide isomerase [Ferruginibacter sp.]|nr:1-(5-phosphoribosyl)-5-[(5-phosphoribosylamino)methylideneamino]imidazole-4-carboxamide isomerase [Cytophagales bacterium]